MLVADCTYSSSVREATKLTDNDENAWAWGRSLLDDFLCIFPCHIFGVYVLFRGLWLGCSIQLVFYFIYVNLQISMAFLMAALFSNVKTAAVVGYILVFGTGLLGGFLFQFFLQDTSFPRVWIIVMELYPGFSLYGGLFEFSQYAFMGNYMGTHGMRWENLSDNNNGKDNSIVGCEWLIFSLIAYYNDRINIMKART
ncbi:ABC transporter A family member 7-like protein isoform X1 [Tanacetum coccineum]